MVVDFDNMLLYLENNDILLMRVMDNRLCAKSRYQISTRWIGLSKSWQAKYQAYLVEKELLKEEEV